MSLNNNKKGSVMIAALILTIITGTIVGFFLKSVTQEVTSSHRSRMSFQAINLAEAGLDHAIYSIRNDDWGGWTARGSAYYRSSFPYVHYSFRGESRRIRVYVLPNASTPKMVAEGRVDLPGGASVSKQIYIELGNSSPFANGISTPNGITFNGNGIYIDSYFSSLGAYDSLYSKPATDHFAWSQYDLTQYPENKFDGGSIASTNVAPDIINMGNADVWGRVASGGSYLSPNPPRVGPNGSIKGKDTPSGVDVDPNRIATDFVADFPPVTAPTSGSALTSYSGSTLGSSGSTTFYNLSELKIKSSDPPLIIQGEVTLVVDGDVEIFGTLELAAGAEIKMYVEGNFEVRGTDSTIVNPTGRPEDFMLYGTGADDPSTSSDETPIFTLQGSTSFYGVVYAPDADIVLGGSGSHKGEMFGAAVGLSVNFGGGYHFHYDEDLANLEDENALKVSVWRELTHADERKNMDTILTDGL